MWTAPHVIRLTTITLRHFGAGERAPSTTSKPDSCDAAKVHHSIIGTERLAWSSCPPRKSEAPLRLVRPRQPPPRRVSLVLPARQPIEKIGCRGTYLPVLGRAIRAFSFRLTTRETTLSAARWVDSLLRAPLASLTLSSWTVPRWQWGAQA